jgi:phosphomannomutase / phosphoglucomutase
MSINPRIFRAYDIRGKAHIDLTTDACFLIGQAFGTILFERTQKEHPIVIVGRDARTHGPELEREVIEGLKHAGCSVRTIGAVPSPINYFTLCTSDADGGMQVTASHNPKEDNGIKLCTSGANAFAGEELQMLYQRILKGGLRRADGGSEEACDAVTPYTQHLTTLFAGCGNNLTVCIDAGNGIAGPVYSQMLKAVGAKVIELYIEPDGTFPNHAADPSKYATLVDLQQSVKEHKADLGLAFDGDGDRVGVIDEKGSVVTADEVLLLLAEDHLSRVKGGTVISTVSNSSVIDTEVQKWGGTSVLCKVGHSFVEHAMHEHSALLGGEQSGHFFCAEDYFGFDDAIVASLRLLSYFQKVGKMEKTLSMKIKEYPRVYQMEELRPFCSDDDKRGVVDRVIAHFQKDHPVLTLDGARIDFGDGAWAGIRYSNTSPCLSICIEARSQGKLEEVQEGVLSHLRTYEEVKWEPK